MADLELKTRLTLGGDKEYKQALSDINKELKLAKSNMSAATSEYDKNDTSAEALQSRYDALKQVFETQKKKVELIRNEMDKLSASDTANKDDIDKLQIALNNATTQMNNTAREMGNLEGAMSDEEEAADEAGDETEDFGDKLKEAGAKAAKVSFAAVAAGLAAVTAAATKAVKKLAEFSSGVASYVDDINTLSVQTGVSVETLQKWGYAENLIDVSTDTMVGSMRKMTAIMGDAKDGSASAMAKFEALGISIYDSEGNLKSAEDLFYEAVDALGQVENETERDALAMDLFGKSATELNPLIEAGTDRLRELGDEAESTGYVMSDEMMQNAQDYQDATDRMSLASTGLKNVIGASVAPTFTKLATTATTAMQKVTVALQDGLQPGELEGILSELIEDITGTFDEILKALTEMMPMFSELLTGLITTLVENLPGFLEVLLPAAFDLLQSVLDALLENLQPIIDLALQLVNSLAKFLLENLPTLVTAAVDIFTGFVDGITEMLPELIPLAVDMMVKLAEALIEALPKIIEATPKIIGAIIDGLMNVDWLQVATDLFTGLVKGMFEALSATISAVQDVFQKIWDAVLELFGIHSPSDVAAEAGDYILQGLIEGFKDAVEGVIQVVKEVFGAIWDAIKSIFGFGKKDDETNSEAKQSGKDIMGGIKDGITGSEKDVKESSKKAAKAVISAINDEWGIKNGKSSKGEELGKWFALGMKTGIEDNAKKIKEAAKKAAKDAYTAAKNELGIASPSKVMAEVGYWYDEGFASGISKNADRVMDAAGALADASANPTSSGLTKASANGAAAAANTAGGGVTINTTYSGPFTTNDASAFSQVLARGLSGARMAMG